MSVSPAQYHDVSLNNLAMELLVTIVIIKYGLPVPLKKEVKVDLSLESNKKEQYIQCVIYETAASWPHLVTVLGHVLLYRNDPIWL